MPATEHDPDFAELATLFSDKVRSRVDELSLTQREVIDRTGLSRGYIQLLLNNRGSHKDVVGAYKPVNPTLDVIWRLTAALELADDYGYLIDRNRPVERFDR
jgi:transcriptional regulator with XRE-family HTH domain